MIRDSLLLTQVDSLRWILAHPLNRGRAMAALFRWLHWHVQTRAGRQHVIDFVNGTSIIGARGLTTANVQRYVGLGELDVMGFLLHALAPGDLFVDVGANIGAASILAAGIGCDVIAFEPVPENFAWLKRNIDLNAFGSRVRPRNCAVGESAGILSMSSEGATSHVETRGEAALAVECTTLDRELDDRPASVIKIDVEGFELPVIRGCVNILKQASLNAVICELKGHGARYGFDEGQVKLQLESAGFRGCSYDPLTRALSHVDFAGARPDNIIFVRNLDILQERLRASPARPTIWGRMI